MPVFRLMDENGVMRPGVPEPDVSRDECLRMYAVMKRLQAMDNVFYDAQRQGRISFYMTNWGEEATQIGTVVALRDDDEIFAQYREAGVLMWRGYTLQDFADQLFGNCDSRDKGRPMPVHYGSAKLHFQPISSPLATQIPQAAGAAFACKREGRGRVVVCYFGDGAASEGDFHAGLNMAATLECPVVYVCRNNGWAISTPVREQYRGDGIAARGIAYGMHTIRVDGNDIWAVREAMISARAIAAGSGDGSGTRPVLVELMTYRLSHHSTSDDSTRYRSSDEIAAWSRGGVHPVTRMRNFLERRGWWDEDMEVALVADARKSVLVALAAGERKPKAALNVSC